MFRTNLAIRRLRRGRRRSAEHHLRRHEPGKWSDGLKMFWGKKEKASNASERADGWKFSVINMVFERRKNEEFQATIKTLDLFRDHSTCCQVVLEFVAGCYASAGDVFAVPWI
jgi:hypothetical protein